MRCGELHHHRHVAPRDPLGDDHDEADAVGHRLQHGVLREGRRDRDHGAVDRRAVRLHRLPHRVEHRHAVHVAPEPARRHAADDLRARAVVQALAREVHGLAARDALDDERRVGVDQDAHPATARRAASFSDTERSA